MWVVDWYKPVVVRVKPNNRMKRNLVASMGVIDDSKMDYDNRSLLKFSCVHLGGVSFVCMLSPCAMCEPED